MSEPVILDTSAPVPSDTAPVLPPADVNPPAPLPLTADELATQEAAAGAPGTPDGPVVLRTNGPTLKEYVAEGYSADTYPPAGYAAKDEPVSDLIFTDSEKAKFRANARWIMAELDWARSGRRAEERETLNP